MERNKKFVNGKPLVPCNNFAELFARRFAFRILVYFCSCPADLQTTASRTADKCLVHLHREAGFVPKDGSDPDKLVKAIKEYKRIKGTHKKNELYLADLLK